MSIKKQYLKSRPVCKVALRVPKEAAGDSKTIHVVGDFNQWEKDATPMKPLKNGDFTCTLELSTEQEAYEFRYLLDQNQWEMTGKQTLMCPIRWQLRIRLSSW